MKARANGRSDLRPTQMRESGILHDVWRRSERQYRRWLPGKGHRSLSSLSASVAWKRVGGGSEFAACCLEGVRRNEGERNKGGGGGGGAVIGKALMQSTGQTNPLGPLIRPYLWLFVSIFLDFLNQ